MKARGAPADPAAPSSLMKERQQAHIDYFPGRVEYWRGLGRDYWPARMLAARDAGRRLTTDDA